MRQALVVGGSALVAFAVEQRLVRQGFASVDMVRDLADAARLAQEEDFDLVVVLSGSCRLSREELLAAAAKFDAPVLVTGNDPLSAIECLVAEPASARAELREPAPRQMAA